MRSKYIRIIMCFVVVFILTMGDGFARKSQKIAVFPPKITGKYIDSKKGQKKVVLIYTSWCPYCRAKMPAFMKMERILPGSVVAISADADNARFAKYIQSYDNIPFKVILNKGDEAGLQTVLGQYGAQPWKGYPTMILMDENNKVVGQGNYTTKQVAEYIFLKPEDLQKAQEGAQ